jgi:hypothetical protein
MLIVDGFCPAKCKRRFKGMIGARNLGTIVASTIRERDKSLERHRR